MTSPLGLIECLKSFIGHQKLGWTRRAPTSSWLPILEPSQFSLLYIHFLPFIWKENDRKRHSRTQKSHPVEFLFVARQTEFYSGWNEFGIARTERENRVLWGLVTLVYVFVLRESPRFFFEQLKHSDRRGREAANLENRMKRKGLIIWATFTCKCLGISYWN